MNMCVNKEYNAVSTENYDKIKHFNIHGLHDNANAFLPDVKHH